MTTTDEETTKAIARAERECPIPVGCQITNRMSPDQAGRLREEYLGSVIAELYARLDAQAVSHEQRSPEANSEKATPEYYILSLRWTRSGEKCVTWWGPDNSGYAHSLEGAGRYSAECVQGCPAYYDNRLTTLAVPCALAEKYARHIVHTDTADALVSEVMGAPVHVHAPFEEDLDHEDKPYECKECETRSRTKGPSKLIVRTT